MKKHRKINLRKKPSQTPLLIVAVGAMALIAIAFASGYKDGKLYRKATYQPPKPVVLHYAPLAKKMVLYKPKSELERQQIIASIWGVKNPDKTIKELKQLARR